MKILRKIFNLLLKAISHPIIIIPFLFCLVIFSVRKYNLSLSKINDNDFMFVFLGLLLGFAFTLYPFIISLVDKITSDYYKTSKNIGKNKEVKHKVKALNSELKDDIWLIFISFFFISILYVIESNPIPYVEDKYYFKKTEIILSCRVTVFLLNIYSIYDIISITFGLSNSTGLFSNEE